MGRGKNIFGRVSRYPVELTWVLGKLKHTAQMKFDEIRSLHA